ncbi:MAG: hypothetical protein K6G80_04725 [Treponema sp.]|nr:hypothetical protein [Treponema sp.]
MHFPELSRYFAILSPEFPEFLKPYIEQPLVQRLSGVGLLCGTDWTPLYQNRFFYTRLYHSIGTALIVWNFTKSKKQTIAALLHDVSTPAFSHVSDFRKGDTLRQEATESANRRMIETDADISTHVFEDGLYAAEISDYHQYPICDNEVPRLSADRLEYMFPSGMALNASWNLPDIARAYKDISVLTAEDGMPELGFTTPDIAADYCTRACGIGLILQRNENKLALNLMGTILNQSLSGHIIEETDLYEQSEAELMQIFAQEAGAKPDTSFASLFRTFTQMTEIAHTDAPMENAYCVSLSVKKRYINPLVQTADGARRITKISETAAKAVSEFLAFEDTAYGCVKLL